MTMTEVLSPHLPYLRRYARALTGSQERGDACVRAALTGLASEDYSLDSALSPRVALYRLFHNVWTKAAARGEAANTGAATPEGRLQSLPSQGRAALLLTAVESFTPSETGIILGQPAEDVERAIVEVQKRIEDELVSRVLIIEDEPIIALDLEHLVTELGHEVVATAATRDSAVEEAKLKKPGLILADINLGDGGSGIDAVTEILDSFDIPVIFVTAYPEKLLTGERPEPTYLIAKPFLPETVQATVGQALFFHPLGRRVAA